jgi:hypothetical protein
MSDDIDVGLLASNISKLEEIYKLSIQQQQVRGFFTHLHNYLEVICGNSNLNELVWTLVIENYNQDNPKHKFKGSIEQLAQGLTVGSEYQGYLENALDAHKGITRAYYCWSLLYSAFDLFDMSPDASDLAIQTTILKDLSQGTKALLQEDDSEYRNIFLKNDDSANKRFRRSDYQLYLEVFHTWLTRIVNEGEIKSAKATQIKQKEREITAEIKFIDSTITLWLSNMGSVSIKSLRTDGPQFHFMNYVLAHPTVDIGRALIQELEGCATKRDLTELVRNSGFDRELKQIFFPKCTQKTIRFTPTKEVSVLQAEQLAQKYKS